MDRTCPALLRHLNWQPLLYIIKKLLFKDQMGLIWFKTIQQLALLWDSNANNGDVPSQAARGFRWPHHTLGVKATHGFPQHHAFLVLLCADSQPICNQGLRSLLTASWELCNVATTILAFLLMLSANLAH